MGALEQQMGNRTGIRVRKRSFRAGKRLVAWRMEYPWRCAQAA